MTDSVKENQINFLLHAERLLVEQFGDRLTMADIAEKAVLLDGAMASLKKAGFLSDVVLKGGGALQRAYLSHRFSSDLDFSCGKIPPFSPQQFNDYGNNFFYFSLRLCRKTMELIKVM
ncbi:MAG: nucleotidyl transferase AbiEii/AbiGii toxin family protein [Desulfovibrionaceae bacterium]|nr:nucleotidyl transferase AbiEii/AbiGii toxin family protein [Desulfovibrionaceae bacterium]